LTRIGGRETEKQPTEIFLKDQKILFTTEFNYVLLSS